METTNLTHEESLQIIQKSIANTRHKLSEESQYYLMWGWLALAAGVIQLALLTFTDSYYHWISWPILMTFGGVMSGILSAKNKKKKKFTSQIDRIMGFIWGGMLVAIVFALFLSFQIGWEASYLIVIMLYGLGTFISGGALKFKPLIIGGVAAWVLGIIGIVAGNWLPDFRSYLILLCASLVVSYLIPGYMLKNSSKDV
jgi:hypothetical protein